MIDWPFLSEAIVAAVSDATHRYEFDGKTVKATEHAPRDVNEWRKTVDRLIRYNSKQLGIIVGDVKTLVHIRRIKGREI